MFRNALLLVLIFLISGCNSRISYHGKFIDNDELKKVQVGSTKEFVFQTIGSPTFETNHSQNVWFYSYKKSEYFLIKETQDKDDKTIAIIFDNQNKVVEIKKINTNDKRDITPINYTTKSVKGKKTFIAQAISNFNRSKNKKK